MNVQYQPNGKVTNPSVNPMKFISSPDELKPFILIRRDNILKEMKTSGHKKKSHSFMYKAQIYIKRYVTYWCY